MQSSATTVLLRSNSPKKVCLSASAVHRRLQRFGERKVIEAEVAIVSPEALGRSVTAIVEVTLNTDRPKIVEEFQRAIQAAPEVLQRTT